MMPTTPSVWWPPNTQAERLQNRTRSSSCWVDRFSSANINKSRPLTLLTVLCQAAVMVLLSKFRLLLAAALQLKCPEEILRIM